MLSFPVADNLVLRTYERPPFARGFQIVQEAIFRFATRLAKEFDIRTRSVRSPASQLSGGNQQKVIIAREFTRGGRLLVAAQPTRGVDVGSTEFIHRKLIDARDKGMAVLLISAELDEVLSLADRIAVMCRGKIAGVLKKRQPRHELLSYVLAALAGQRLTRPRQPHSCSVNGSIYSTAEYPGYDGLGQVDGELCRGYADERVRRSWVDAAASTPPAPPPARASGYYDAHRRPAAQPATAPTAPPAHPVSRPQLEVDRGR